jgi:hypothetical protein
MVKQTATLPGSEACLWPYMVLPSGLLLLPLGLLLLLVVVQKAEREGSVALRSIEQVVSIVVLV